MEGLQRVTTAVNIVDGGIGINWGWPGMEDEKFRRLLRELLFAAGFPSRATVRFQNNRDGERVDWQRPRISADDCQVNAVNPHEAIVKIRRWLMSEYVQTEYGLMFDIISREPVAGEIRN